MQGGHIKAQCPAGAQDSHDLPAPTVALGDPLIPLDNPCLCRGDLGIQMRAPVFDDGPMEEFDLIKFPQRGVCLYKCGNERYLLEVHAPPYKEALFGKAGGR